MQLKAVPFKLWRDPAIASTLTWYQRLGDSTGSRPALLIIPGGGYATVCESTEGEPVARRFAELGFQVFVLNYRTLPASPDAPLSDALRAIKMIRFHAADWQVVPENLAVCGFSAGGHLAAAAALFWDQVAANDQDAADGANARPDALVLGYPVISLEPPFGHVGSGENLLGDHYRELRHAYSLENQVDTHTPPTYLWHTAEDQIVPVENSLLFAAAMRRNKRPCELRIFPFGPHGMQLGYGRSDIAGWPQEAKYFLEGSCGFRFPAAEAVRERHVRLLFGLGCAPYLNQIGMLLKRNGFDSGIARECAQSIPAGLALDAPDGILPFYQAVAPADSGQEVTLTILRPLSGKFPSDGDFAKFLEYLAINNYRVRGSC